MGISINDRRIWELGKKINSGLVPSFDFLGHSITSQVPDINILMIISCLCSFSLKDHSRTFFDVIFERFAQVVPKIGLHRNISAHRDSWVKGIHRWIDWNLLSCKFYNL
jgi:predicted anti-sigma-YlaC factor YlaD